MAVAKGVEFDVGAETASSLGIISSDIRALRLTAGQTALRRTGYIAINGLLVQAFAASVEGAGRHVEGAESYVGGLIEDIRVKYPSAAVALAIRLDHDLLLAATGGAVSEVMSLSGDRGAKVLVDAPYGKAVERVAMASDQFLLLAGASLGSQTESWEIRKTVQGCATVQQAAAWLATLASGRSGAEATAIVAKMEGKRTRPKRMQSTEPAPVRSAALPGFSPLTTVAPAAAVILLAGLTVGAVVLTRAHAAAPSSPGHMRASRISPDSVALSWSAAPGVSSYVVKVGGSSYATKSQSLVLLNVLPGGSTQTWKVSAMFGKRLGPSWPVGTFVVPLAISSVTPTEISPPADVRSPLAKGTTSVLFCWTFAGRARSYALRITGGGHRYDHWHLRGRLLSHTKQGAACYSQPLPVGTAYSWRVGAKVRGFLRSWTNSEHFTIATK